MQYTAGMQRRLKGIANVFRAPDNCRSTRQTLAAIETYLGDIPWDVIHFNCGIHDVTHFDSDGQTARPPIGVQQVPIEEYCENLRKLLPRFQATGARLIWASTTPIGLAASETGDSSRC